ncbi:hypothetical protein K438DRAFT_2008430 [Mycena galopus ATCC 62051]|nr:hypothetical protein K438DRAFT_2008430 [Mycena galopus ATCC 62051]
MGLNSDTSPCNSNRAVAHKKLTLENACSVGDLLAAVRDVVAILRELFFQHQILHKHIDYNNISIRTDSDHGTKGVVLDLDFPDVTEEGTSRSTDDDASRGSLGFRSVQLLRDLSNETRHQNTLQDDLESVFYVLCWACYGYDHKGRPDRFRPCWMAAWKDRYTSSVLSSKITFRSHEIESHVNRYMGCQRDILESVIEKIRTKTARLSSDPEKACTEILNILEDGIKESLEEACCTTSECSAMRAANGALR